MLWQYDVKYGKYKFEIIPIKDICNECAQISNARYEHRNRRRNIDTRTKYGFLLLIKLEAIN